jgi:hypothetical protein
VDAGGIAIATHLTSFTGTKLQVLTQLRQVSGGRVQATSLWHNLDGSASWHPCDALEYSEKEEKLLIKWHANAKTKWVIRMSVCFAPFESEEDLMRRRQRALDNRARVEAIMRFEHKIDAMPLAGVHALAPEHFHKIVARMGRQDDKEVLASRPTLINEVLALYSRVMLLIKHRRTFPEDDPTVNTLDGIEQAGLATLPNVMLKIPGHAAYVVVPVTGAIREDDVVAANSKRNKTFRKTAVTIAASLSWLPSFMCKALTLMRTHILRLEKTSFFWDMAQTVTVDEFVQRHRSAAKDAIGFLMSTLMDLMSDALLTAYSEEEALLGSAAAMSAHQRDKYCLVTKLANRMLSDAVRSCLMRDLEKYAATYAVLCRPPAPPPPPTPRNSSGSTAMSPVKEDAADGGEGIELREGTGMGGMEYAGQKEQLPAKLSHGKRWGREPIFQLELVYATEAAPPPDPAIAAAAAVAAAVEHAENVKKALEKGQEPPAPPPPPVHRDAGVVGVAKVLPDDSSVLHASTEVVTELINALNVLPSFCIAVIDAFPDCTHLVSVSHDESFVLACFATVVASVSDNSYGPAALVELIAEHTLLVRVDVAAHCENFVESVHPVQETHAEVEKYSRPACKMREEMPDTLTIRMHRISTTDLKDAVEHKASQIRHKLQSSLAAETLERNEAVKLQYRRMMERILTPPSSAKELADLQQYTAAMPEQLRELGVEQVKIRNSFALLESMGQDISSSDVAAVWETLGCPAALAKTQGLVLQRQEDERLRFMSGVCVVFICTHTHTH